MDMATDLRIQMARQDVSVAYVAGLVDRNRITVSRWRTGTTPIDLDCARILHAHDLLSAESILGIEGAA